MKSIQEAFRAPDAEFSPFPFWFLNGDLNDGELERQLNDFLSHGVRAVVLHPRVGVPESLCYLSDAFLDRIETIVSFAAAHGMRVLLYDEGMYPSGSAHGMVVQENPAYAARGLCLRAPGDAPEEGDKTLVRIALVRSGEGFVPGSARVLEPEEVPSADETECRLVAGFTRGTIRGIHENEDDGQPNAPAAADLLNAEAMQAFIRLTHQRYYDRLKPYFGETILGFFTDEPSPTGRAGRRGMCPWTEGFEAELAEKGFPLADLPALFLPCGGAEKKIRARFSRLVDERMTRTYYKPISDWCVSHGIALCGPPARAAEHQAAGKLWHSGAGHRVALGRAGKRSGAGRRGERAGKVRVGRSEAYRRAAQPERMLRLLRAERGNVGVQRGRYALVSELAVRARLQSHHPARVLLRAGASRADGSPTGRGPEQHLVAALWADCFVHRPRLHAEYRRRESGACGRAGHGDSLPVEKVRALYERQIEFNYLTDEQLLKLGMPENGALAVAKQRYEAVLLDDALEYDEAALAALRTYAKQGLKIVHSTRALGDKWRTVRLSGSASGIRASHVKRGDEEFVLLANELGGDYSGTATLPFTGTVAVLDPWTGEAWRENAESGRLKVHLERRQLLYVCRCAGAEELPLKVPAGRIRETKPLDDCWQLTLPDGSAVPGVGDWQGSKRYAYSPAG